MDITKLTIGRPVRIKTEDDIYDSYISAITLKDENFVYFKSGSIRVSLLDKLKKSSGGNGDKLDKTGGVILGNLDIKGNVTKSGQQIVTHNTDKSIVSDGTFNKGSWNIPKEGALTQIINNDKAQHSVIVGRGEDGRRYYGIDLLDSYDAPQMMLFVGSDYLRIDSGRLIFNGTIISDFINNNIKGVQITDSNRNLLDTTRYLLPFSLGSGQRFDNITIPIYSKGIVVSAGGSTSDACLMAIDSEGNFYTGFRVGSTWRNCKKWNY